MRLSRQSFLASVMLASGLVFTLFGSAYGQRAVYRTVSGHGYGHGCPCPTDCPEADGSAPSTEEMGEVPADAMGEDLPEVADLSGDTALASASQSAAPNAIGDSLSRGLIVDFDDELDIVGALPPPGGGTRFKATNNNSAIPQCRVFFNYNHYENAYGIADTSGAIDVVGDINVDHYEFGLEHAIWNNMASVQVRVPFNTTLDSTINSDVDPLATDTEFGNLNLALKAVLYQDCCKTVSLGLGLDLPTADDLTIVRPSDGITFVLENEAVILSPYLAAYNRIGCNAFVNSFAQVAIPVNENSVSFVETPDPALTGELAEATYLYLDVSLGYWLRQDCCGNGIAAIAELHYTNALSDDEAILDPNDVELFTGDFESLNATLGAAVVNGCWSVAPAVVLPVLQDPDRAFDWELAVYVNRRF